MEATLRIAERNGSRLVLAGDIQQLKAWKQDAPSRNCSAERDEDGHRGSDPAPEDS